MPCAHLRKRPAAFLGAGSVPLACYEGPGHWHWDQRMTPRWLHVLVQPKCITEKSNLFSGKCKFTTQGCSSLEKSLEIGVSKMVANRLPRIRHHGKGQTWNLLFFQKLWTANSLRSSTDTARFPMGMGVTLAKP